MLAVGTGAAAYVWTFPHSNPPKDFLHADPSEFTPFGDYGVSVGFTRDSRILLTAGDLAVEGWDIKDQLRLFDAYINHGAGNLDLAGTRFVTAAAIGWPCSRAISAAGSHNCWRWRSAAWRGW